MKTNKSDSVYFNAIKINAIAMPGYLYTVWAQLNTL